MGSIGTMQAFHYEENRFFKNYEYTENRGMLFGNYCILKKAKNLDNEMVVEICKVKIAELCKDRDFSEKERQYADLLIKGDTESEEFQKLDEELMLPMYVKTLGHVYKFQTILAELCTNEDVLEFAKEQLYKVITSNQDEESKSLEI